MPSRVPYLLTGARRAVSRGLRQRGEERLGELLATSPAAAQLLGLGERGVSHNPELGELLGAAAEASAPAGRSAHWTARNGAQFQVKAAALPAQGVSTLMIRLVPCGPAPAADERPISRLARDAGLSPREASILDALARGKSHKEVAAELGVAYFTVTTHVRNLFAKLGVKNRIDAINAVKRGRSSSQVGI